MRAKKNFHAPKMDLSFLALCSKFHFPPAEIFLVLGVWVGWPVGGVLQIIPPPPPQDKSILALINEGTCAT